MAAGPSAGAARVGVVGDAVDDGDGCAAEVADRPRVWDIASLAGFAFAERGAGVEVELDDVDVDASVTAVDREPSSAHAGTVTAVDREPSSAHAGMVKDDVASAVAPASNNTRRDAWREDRFLRASARHRE